MEQGNEADVEKVVTTELLQQWRKECPSCYEKWLIERAAPNLSITEKSALKEVLEQDKTGQKQHKRIEGPFWSYPVLNRILGRE